jgi:hypothetical protein
MDALTEDDEREGEGEIEGEDVGGGGEGGFLFSKEDSEDVRLLALSPAAPAVLAPVPLLVDALALPAPLELVGKCKSGCGAEVSEKTGGSVIEKIRT